MSSITAMNKVYNPYRNSVVGKTSDYSTRVDLDTDVLMSFFSDDGTVTPDSDHVFVSSYDTSLNPSFANRLVLGSVTVATVPVAGTNDDRAGVMDAADAVFTGAAVLTGTTSVESYIVAKVISAASATSPVLLHYGVATGLPLTPNGADVTVVMNASGLFRF